MDYSVYQNMFTNCSNIKKIHFPKSLENDDTFNNQMPDSPTFGATNATAEFDL